MIRLNSEAFFAKMVYVKLQNRDSMLLMDFYGVEDYVPCL